LALFLGPFFSKPNSFFTSPKTDTFAQYLPLQLHVVPQMKHFFFFLLWVLKPWTWEHIPIRVAIPTVEIQIWTPVMVAVVVFVDLLMKLISLFFR